MTGILPVEDQRARIPEIVGRMAIAIPRIDLNDSGVTITLATAARIPGEGWRMIFPREC